MKALLDPQVTPSEAATDAALAEACRQVKDVGSQLQGPVSGSAQPERIPASDHLQAPLALVEASRCNVQARQDGCDAGHNALRLHTRLALGGGMWPNRVALL